MTKKIGVFYHSKTGNTKKMARAVTEGIEKVKPTFQIILKKADEANEDDLLECDGIIVGSPTYYGQPAAEVKKLFDRSVKHHGKLEGKIGAAFSSSENLGGGNETTILSILEMMLVHGMIIKGSPSEDHYGPVSIGEPDLKTKEKCKKLGATIAELVSSF